ncbi:unnamed protein product [Auanema sp. JU1783]|nr:unnamed protein product [Auanema sp. JU1783]
MAVISSRVLLKEHEGNLQQTCSTMYKLAIFAALALSVSAVAIINDATMPSTTCTHCICLHESGCKAIGCNMDVGSLSCGYYQIKLPYYQDCGQIGRQKGEDINTAWKRCANDLTCSTNCVKAYYDRYAGQCTGTGQSPCEVMSRNHNGGPRGCHSSSTAGYWKAISDCCKGQC